MDIVKFDQGRRTRKCSNYNLIMAIWSYSPTNFIKHIKFPAAVVAKTLSPSQRIQSITFDGKNAENNNLENHRRKTNRPAWSSSTPCHISTGYLRKIRICSSKGLVKSWSILQNTEILKHFFRRTTSWVPLTEGMAHFEEALMH